MAHLTMGPQATLALFTFSKLNSGLFRYFVFILFRMSKRQLATYVMSSVLKLTMVLMKFSRMMTERMAFQSEAASPSSRQIDSSASFTANGGLPIERTSTRCCFLMDLTAKGTTRRSAITLCLFSAITSSCF
ncbi:unnamed protein product [Ixodes hexagonus]